MATLEDAAEDLVVKLRGLDSEMAESEQKLGDLRVRIEGVASDVEQEWTALNAAASSFLDTVKEEAGRLAQHAQEAVQAVADTHEAVAEDGAEARSEIAEGRSQLEALGEHAEALEPGVESVAAETGEAPARSLAERARELEQELTRVVEEAGAFLHEEVVPAVQELTEEVRQGCQELRRSLAEEGAPSLQKAFDEWETAVEALEEHIATEAFQASHQHARDVVEYALDECETASQQQLDDLQQFVGLMVAQLQALVSEARQSADALVVQAGAALGQELEQTCVAAAEAVAALDRVRDSLAAHSFMEV